MQSIDLSSLSWKFGKAGQTPRLAARVPGCVHTDLIRNGKIKDPFWGTNELDLQWIGQTEWEYAADFDVSADTLTQTHVELVAEGLDTIATVYINGRCVAKTNNMFAPLRADVRKLLKAGKNNIRVVFADAEAYVRRMYPNHRPFEFNDPVGRCVVIRKEQCQFGWDWGPRFVTAGIWRPIRLEAWSGCRIEHVKISQTHSVKIGEKAAVIVEPELRGSPKGCRVRAVLSFGGNTVAEVEQPCGKTALALEVKKPRLWWPAGQGEQPLYDLVVELLDGEGKIVETIKRRVGLRTLRLDRHKDKWGESFQFVVNGRAVFAKGANWIPAHSFVAGLTRKDYERDIRAAQQANMNMLRVWGGGIYESEDFYDLCDEMGLMVWQDFMFACTLYPGEKSFMDAVRPEAVYQVRRLRHRACLALWCGNNELPQINKEDLEKPKNRADYERLFHKLLPDVLKEHGGQTDYWPSSEWRGKFGTDFADGEQCGDTHFWRVWHLRYPVKEYEQWQLRFCSEFGMQSYSSLTTQDTFCPPDQANIFGPMMENHQKNRAGNQIISDYISRRYRFPKDHASLIYLSQLNQAYCVGTGVEHYRRIAPRCMGALYWQLNDCWPVASWSSVEFTGAWRALHYCAKRFFAPAMVSARTIDDESVIIGNYRKKTAGKLELYTVYDAPAPTKAMLRWELRELGSAKIIRSEKKSVQLRHGESRLQCKLDFGKELAERGTDAIYLRMILEKGSEILSEGTVFFAPPRFLELPKGKTAIRAKQVKAGEFAVTFTSSVFQHAFSFETVGTVIQASDNFFDLYPGIAKTVTVQVPEKWKQADLLKQLSCRSLVDSY